MRTAAEGIVTLEAFGPGHAAELWPVSPVETFEYFLSKPADGSRGAFAAFLEASIADMKAETFVVRDAATGRAVGSSSFLDLRPIHRGLEIGFTWYDALVRGTRVNPACKLLMLQRAFEERGCMRVQLKCHNGNERSKRAILKLGATFEGVLRKHMMLRDGRHRDTAMFSITDEEWPRVRAGLEKRLC